MGNTILLADADHQLVTMLKSLLSGRGYVPTHAESGREVLEQIGKESPSLVIVGEQLTDIDGIGLIIKIRKSYPDVKLAFISNEWREANLYQQLTKDFRVELIVHRPLKPSLFAAQIDSQLRHQQAIKQNSGSEQEEKTFLTLRSRFAEVLPTRLSLISDAIELATTNNTNKDLTAEARRLAHNLKGTASSCGFTLVGEAASHLERAIVQIQQDQYGDILEAWSEVMLLFEAVSHQAQIELENNIPTHAQLEKLADDSAMAKVLLVGSEFFSEGKEALQSGLPIKVIAASSAHDALDKATATTLDAVIIDMDSSPEESMNLARELRGMIGYESLPLAFIAKGAAPDDRIESTHAGASIFLDKPLNTSTLNKGIEYLLGVRGGGRHRVLVIDDDEDFSSIIAHALGKEGMLVKVLNDPTGVLQAMENFLPDLVLLDVMMPGISGFQVCKMLRETSRWQDVPILFLTAETELDARLAAFDAGGDDYLPKPVAPVELLTRVKVRLERARLLRDRADRDILSGLFLRRAFMEQLNALISESERYNLVFSLALLDVDHFKKVNDTYGHLAGDRVLAHLGQLLKRRFRVEDLRGRWGGEEFIVAFRHEAKETTIGALARVLEELRQTEFNGDHGEVFHVSFTAGMSSFPEDGRTIEDLVHVSDQRLYLGKECGRNRIIGNG
ncbi:MAG: response regulator [Cyanobacteria bacterium SZAS-4]|nr:response regulator [Cyanobacteria bacterium SZAS-4]